MPEFKLVLSHPTSSGRTWRSVDISKGEEEFWSPSSSESSFLQHFCSSHISSNSQEEMLNSIQKLSIVRQSRTILLRLLHKLMDQRAKLICRTIIPLPKTIKQQQWLPMEQVTTSAFVKNLAPQSDQSKTTKTSARCTPRTK
jgi:hypothetical protein